MAIMIRIIICSVALSLVSCATQAQLPTSPTNATMRTIEVTGKSTEEIEPDKIIFTIAMQEYWEEEFQEGTKYEDYRTKVDIEKIENNVVDELKAQGIKMDQITLQRAGNYWRQQGKDFLISKTLEIKIKTAKEANHLTNVLKTRGIQSMNIREMKHSQLEDYQLATKANAIKAAQLKAQKMVEALGQDLGKVISIIELDRYAGVTPKLYANARSADMMSAEAAGGVEYENFQKIKISEEVRVIFEIK